MTFVVNLSMCNCLYCYYINKMWRRAKYFVGGGGLGSLAGAAVGLGVAAGVEAVSFGLAVGYTLWP